MMWLNLWARVQVILFQSSVYIFSKLLRNFDCHLEAKMASKIALQI